MDNGRSDVFHLRRGVKCHDGTDFDADAVRWNVQLILNPENKAFMRSFLEIGESIEAIDAPTVKFTLKPPSFTLLPNLAQYREGILFKSPMAAKSRDRLGERVDGYR